MESSNNERLYISSDLCQTLHFTVLVWCKPTMLLPILNTHHYDHSTINILKIFGGKPVSDFWVK